MRRLIFRILATIGGAVVGAVLLGLAARSLWRGHVPTRTVVEVDLERPLVEYVPDDPLANLLQSRRTRLREVLDGLARAKADDHVVALLAHADATTPTAQAPLAQKDASNRVLRATCWTA